MAAVKTEIPEENGEDRDNENDIDDEIVGENNTDAIKKKKKKKKKKKPGEFMTFMYTRIQTMKR